MIHRYNDVFDYLYPRVLSIPHQHIIFKNDFITALNRQPILIYTAVESDQISKYREADRGMKYIRWMLRKASALTGVKLGKSGPEEAERRLYAVGGMINAAIKRLEQPKGDQKKQ